jgi:hypothetical protein
VLLRDITFMLPSNFMAPTTAITPERFRPSLANSVSAENKKIHISGATGIFPSAISVSGITQGRN